MNPQTRFDLSACRHWRKSAALGPARVGIIPAWNAVTVLNPAAADIWDLLIETGDLGSAASRYAQLWPERADMAPHDVAACLGAWEKQGLLHAPPPSPEQQKIRQSDGRTVVPEHRVSFRRTVSVAGQPVTLEIVDPTLSRAIEDLLADFPNAAAASAPTLRATGPSGGWYLTLDGTPIRLAASFLEARGQIVAELIRLAGGDTGWLATAHGAVLTGPSGPVFLAGSSGAGKSTLSAGLVALGWEILAEDCAAFDARLNVSPLPFALSIKDGAVGALTEAFPDLASARVHELGQRRVRYQRVPEQGRASRPQRPDLILDVGYTPGMDPGDVRLDPLSPLETLGLFMNEESYIDFEHRSAQDFLDFVERTPAYAISYESIPAAEKAIRARLDWHRREGGR